MTSSPFPSSTSSRQKSCNACVLGKRRCDKRLPACGRCVRQKTACSYGGTARRRPDQQQPAHPDTPEPAQYPDLSIGGIDTLMGPDVDSGGAMALNSPDFLALLGPDNLTLEQQPQQPDAPYDWGPSEGATFDFGTMMALPGAPADLAGAEQIFLHSQQQHPPRVSTPLPTSKEGVLTRKDYMHLGTVCEDYQPWQLEDPSNKMGFIVEQIKALPAVFAATQSTPYCHRALYGGGGDSSSDMPPCITQVYAACALYANRTAQNRAIVLRVLLDSVAALVAGDMKRSTTVPLPTSPPSPASSSAAARALSSREKLARIHALILYQVIRMFDGNITLAQQADGDFDLLEAWTQDLCNVRDNLAAAAAMDGETLRGSPPESWQRWVFSESLRRTVVMAHVLRTVWNLLRAYKGAKDVGNWAFVHRWTLSSHLWEAPSSFDFFRAWKEKPFWVISVFDFTQFLKTGKGADIDELGRWFLTLYFGVDEIRTFLADTDSTQPAK